jgi:sec-independent protein translocase protein TatB
VFGSLGWLEVGMLLVVALLVFGPDKLPSVARDAARMLRELRSMAQGARTQLKSELGPEFADFDLDTLNPRTFVRKHLLEGEDDLLGDLDQPMSPVEPPAAAAPPPETDATAQSPTSPTSPVSPAASAKQATPFDPDAT